MIISSKKKGTIVVTATDLDIRNLSFATDKVDASGSVVALDAPTLATLELIGVKGADGSTIASNANPVPVNGTLTVTPSGTQDVNITKVGGVALTEGQKTSANSIPTVLSSEQEAIFQSILTQLQNNKDFEQSIWKDTNGTFYLIRVLYNESTGLYIQTTVLVDGTPYVIVGLPSQQVPVGGNKDFEFDHINYKANAGGSGYSFGDYILRTNVFDTTTSPPTLASTIWFNETTGLAISTPTSGTIDPFNLPLTISNLFNLESTQVSVLARLTTLLTLLPASLGQKVMAQSFAVTIASDQTALPITAASLPLPTGAAIAANQQTDALTNTQLRASAVPVSGTFFQATQPISAASLPLPTLASTSTKQSDGSQKTQIVDGGGNVIGSTGNALDVNIKTPNPLPVSGTLTTIPTGTQDENLKQVNGVTVNVGTGAAGAGTQRVSVSSDSFPATQAISAVSLPLPTGASTSANQTNRAQLTQITDGTNDVSVKAASVLPVATDKALVVTLRDAIITTPTSGAWSNGVETTVGASSIQVQAANANRRSLIIQNTGLANARIGITGVTSTTGVRLVPNGQIILRMPFIETNAVFAIREGAISTTILTQETT